MGILILIVPVALLWLLIVRPQQRRMRDQAALTAKAGFGDEVVTAGGFIATIVSEYDPDDDDNDLERDELIVSLAEGFEVHMLRRGIAQIRERWDGEYDDGTIDAEYLADSPIDIAAPTDTSPEVPDSPIDGD
jgi:preprotein translocase subunit YajC